jgi:hypothetical protein
MSVLSLGGPHVKQVVQRESCVQHIVCSETWPVAGTFGCTSTF